MNGSAFPALASQVSVSVGGAGSYLPDHRVSNQEILQYLRPARPDGRLLEPEWVVKHLGIYERRLDYEFGGRRKRGRSDGGIYDGDLALAAARSALGDAGIGAGEVDIFVHVTSTPDLSPFRTRLPPPVTQPSSSQDGGGGRNRGQGLSAPANRP